MYSHPIFYWACDYLPMLGLKLNHVSKMGQFSLVIMISNFLLIVWWRHSKWLMRTPRSHATSSVDIFFCIPSSRWSAMHLRLLHSSSLVAIGLSVGYEICPPIGWHQALWLVGLNIDWDCPVPHRIMGSHDQWEFPLFFRPQWQYPCTALTADICLPLGLCKWTVKESTCIYYLILACLHSSFNELPQILRLNNSWMLPHLLLLLWCHTGKTHRFQHRVQRHLSHTAFTMFGPCHDGSEDLHLRCHI